jgi:hypothetical protein
MFRALITRVAMPGLAVSALVFGNAGAALAAPGVLVNVEGKADFVAVTDINVVVDVNCGAGSNVGQVFVSASQSSATGNASGFGSRSFVSDGTRQQVVVTVTGTGWNVGPAVATAQLTCGGVFVGQDLGARIDIQ